MPLNSAPGSARALTDKSRHIRENPCQSVARILELSRVLFGPALDYHFLICVELDGVAALAVEIAEEAILPSAEGKVGHGRGDADIDADVAGRGFVAETARRR